MGLGRSDSRRGSCMSAVCQGNCKEEQGGGRQELVMWTLRSLLSSGENISVTVVVSRIWPMITYSINKLLHEDRCHTYGQPLDNIT